MTSYTSSLIFLTITYFQLVPILALNCLHTDDNRFGLSVAYNFIVFMYLIMLHILMTSGHILGDRVKQSNRVLDDVIILQETSSGLKKDSCSKLFVLRKRSEVYQFVCPISPYSVFILSTGTFFCNISSNNNLYSCLFKIKGNGNFKCICCSECH